MNNYGNNRYNNRQNQGGGYNQSTIQPVTAQPLPEDYVYRAEQAMIQLKEADSAQFRGPRVITSSKLRSLFSLFAEVYNEAVRGDSDKLSQAQVDALNAAKVRIYYEIGREEGYRGSLDSGSVGRFVDKSMLLQYLYGIGDSSDKLMRFYHYMEALVAFHKYYFGDK